MYLYLGQDTVVNTGNIIGIFDLENTTVSRTTKLYLSAAQREGRVREVSPDLPKSFVVAEEKGRLQVYLSQISPATLRKRAAQLGEPTTLYSYGKK